MRLITAAGIIACHYSGCSMAEIYHSAISNYENLLLILEDTRTAEELSRVMDMPAGRIREITQSIVSGLLFNKSKDPFVSLGLRRDASLPEAHQRWKRLMMLYHPDRLNGSGGSEDRAKRINEAFAELSRLKDEPAVPVKETVQPISFRHMRYIPIAILGLAVITAVSMMIYFMARILKAYKL